MFDKLGSASAHPLVKKFVRVARLYFEGPEGRRGFSLAGIVVLTCAATTALLVWLSYTQRDLGTALQKKDAPGYYSAIVHFVGVVVVAAPLFAFYHFIQDTLSLEWRNWLTCYLLTQYYTSHSYYKLKMENKLDNPDQRICEDVRSFVDGTVGLLTIVVGKTLKCVAFISILWSVSKLLVFFLVAYAAAGTGVTTMVFGAKLTGLMSALLQRSADLRFCLVRSRENAETIAFFSGEAHELHVAQSRMSLLIETLRENILWSRHLAIFTNSYNYMTIVLPGLIIAPRYFAGE
ncbi:hypothetical protein CYMTET_5004, partial [Cymbomonas tetramitiformis]